MSRALTPGNRGKVGHAKHGAGGTRVWASYRDAAGVVHHVSVILPLAAPGQEEMEAAISRAIKLRFSPVEATSSLTRASSIADLGQAWLASLNPEKLQVQTRARYAASVKVINRHMGGLRLHEVTEKIIRDFFTSLEGHYAEAKSSRVVLRAMLVYAVGCGAVTTSPMPANQLLRLEGGSTRTPRAATIPEMRFFHARVEQVRRERRFGPKTTTQLDTAVDILTVQLGFGRRISEIAAIFAEDVRAEGETLFVHFHRAVKYQGPEGKQLTAGKRPRYETPGFYFVDDADKTGSDVTIAADAATAAVIRRRLAAHPRGLLFRTDDTKHNGKPLNLHNVRRTLRAITEGTALEAWFTPHTMRKTFATAVADDARTRGLSEAQVIAEVGRALTHKDAGAVAKKHYIQPPASVIDFAALTTGLHGITQ